MTDLLLALFIAGYVVGGWRTGFLRRLAGLAFIAIALIAVAGILSVGAFFLLGLVLLARVRAGGPADRTPPAS